MSETIPLEEILREEDFPAHLGPQTDDLVRLANTVLSGSGLWTKRHYFQVYHDSNELESFLDDHGARWNRSFHFLTELVASIRGLAMAGFNTEHLVRRLESYGVTGSFSESEAEAVESEVSEVSAFLRASLKGLFRALLEELRAHGVEPSGETLPAPLVEMAPVAKLPRNVGQEEPVDEEQKIAEVATRYLEACGMLEAVGVRRIEDADAVEGFLSSHCTEERARVYEATIHNLQSAYDTHIKNTVLESRDERLPRLRGHISAALHLFEVLTSLTHFVERHEGAQRDHEASRLVSQIVDRAQVRSRSLNVLLYWAHIVLQRGRALADELLPNYLDLCELEVEMGPGITLHARPASLVVGVVNHHGTPVEMEVAGQSCNAGSILELMVAVGSHPEERRYTFRGDARTLDDLQLLFEAGVGEHGLDQLPDRLAYLKS